MVPGLLPSLEVPWVTVPLSGESTIVARQSMLLSRGLSRSLGRVAGLSPVALLAACSSQASSFCDSCDAQGDLPIDRSIGAILGDAGPADSKRRQPIDFAPAIVADAGPADQSEVPRQTAISDGGYLYVADFESGGAEGWQVLHWIDASVPNPDWVAAVTDAGSVYAEETLDITDWHISYTMTASSVDQIVEAKMRVLDFYGRAPSYAAALFGRYHPVADRGYLVALRGDGSLVIRRRDQGTTSSWNGGVDVGIEPGVWYTVRLEILGETISAYLDGNFVCAVTDSDPLPAGGVALGTFGATAEVDRVVLAAP